MSVYMVYVCDEWLTLSTRQVIGVFTSYVAVEKGIRQYIKDNELEAFSDDDLIDINTIGQTQGREDNFMIEETTLNKLL